MKNMKRYGWGLADSCGSKVSCLVFQTKKAAIKYRDSLLERHPGQQCSIIELFAVRRETWDQ